MSDYITDIVLKKKINKNYKNLRKLKKRKTIKNDFNIVINKSKRLHTGGFKMPSFKVKSKSATITPTKPESNNSPTTKKKSRKKRLKDFASRKLFKSSSSAQKAKMGEEDLAKKLKNKQKLIKRFASGFSKSIKFVGSYATAPIAKIGEWGVGVKRYIGGYEGAIKKQEGKISEVNSYIEKLKKMKENSGKNGNVEQSKAIQAEIDKQEKLKSELKSKQENLLTKKDFTISKSASNLYKFISDGNKRIGTVIKHSFQNTGRHILRQRYQIANDLNKRADEYGKQITELQNKIDTEKNLSESEKKKIQKRINTLGARRNNLIQKSVYHRRRGIEIKQSGMLTYMHRSSQRGELKNAFNNLNFTNKTTDDDKIKGLLTSCDSIKTELKKMGVPVENIKDMPINQRKAILDLYEQIKNRGDMLGKSPYELEAIRRKFLYSIVNSKKANNLYLTKEIPRTGQLPTTKSLKDLLQEHTLRLKDPNSSTVKPNNSTNATKPTTNPNKPLTNLTNIPKPNDATSNANPPIKQSNSTNNSTKPNNTTIKPSNSLEFPKSPRLKESDLNSAEHTDAVSNFIKTYRNDLPNNASAMPKNVIEIFESPLKTLLKTYSGAENFKKRKEIRELHEDVHELSKLEKQLESNNTTQNKGDLEQKIKALREKLRTHSYNLFKPDDNYNNVMSKVSRTNEKRPNSEYFNVQPDKNPNIVVNIPSNTSQPNSKTENPNTTLYSNAISNTKPNSNIQGARNPMFDSFKHNYPNNSLYSNISTNPQVPKGTMDSGEYLNVTPTPS